MRKTFLILFCGIAQFAFSQTETWTIEDVVGKVLENNFQIQLARNNKRIAEQNNTIGNAGFLPVLSASANFDRSTQNTEQEFANGDIQSVSGASRNFRSFALDVDWTIFDGLRMFTNRKLLENSVLREQYTLKSQVDNTLANAYSLFYGVALEQERLALFQSNLEFSRQRLVIVSQEYELGKSSKLEFLQAQVDFNTDSSALVQQRELLTTQKLNLIGLFNESMDPNFDVEYQLQIDSTLVLGDLISSMNSQNPQVISFLYDQKIADDNVKIATQARYPVVNFNAGFDASNLRSEAGFLFRNQSDGFNYGLSARVNLFDGLNRRRQIQNARVQAESAELSYQATINALEVLVKNSFNVYQNNLRLRSIEQQNLQVAKENVEIALERFRLGASDALEIREAQINAINAEIRYLQAVFNAKQAEIELLRLSGQISQQQ